MIHDRRPPLPPPGHFALGLGVVAWLTASPVRGETAMHFADHIAGAHYTQHVHFQTVDDVTYIVLNATADKDPHAWAYDHTTGRWQNGGEGVFIAKNPQDNDDDHGNPSIIVDDAGYLHAFFGGHSHYNNGYQQYYRSTRPGDVGQWQKMNFETYSTYPMGWTNSDGSISVMYRNGPHSMPGSSPWVIQTSEDHGQTWSAKRKIIDTMTPQSDKDIYAFPVKIPGQDKVGIGLSDEYLEGSTPHTTEAIYYLTYDVTGDTFHAADGETVSIGSGGVDKDQVASFLVADYANLGNVRKRISARPVITPEGKIHVMATLGDPSRFDTSGTYGGLPRFWTWDDEEDQWDFAEPGHGMAYWVEEDGEALISVKGGGEPWLKELIRSTDGGATWQTIETIEIPGHDGDGFATLFNHGGRGMHPDARLIFLENGDDANNRVYLWGDSGFIAVPEPATLGLMTAGGLLTIWRRRA